MRANLNLVCGPYDNMQVPCANNLVFQVLEKMSAKQQQNNKLQVMSQKSLFATHTLLIFMTCRKFITVSLTAVYFVSV